jgi:hypothetical protein
MMKIITTMRMAKPAISPVRMPLIRVCVRRRRGACGAGRGGGLEPLAEGGGRVLVVACGAAGSVMGLLPSPVGHRVVEDLGRFPLLTGHLAAIGRCFPVSVLNLHLKPKTSNIFLEI